MFSYSEEQLKSLARVEETRPERTGKDLRRLTADEKDALLAAFHPDYIRSAYTDLQVGPNAGAPVLKELAALLQGTPRCVKICPYAHVIIASALKALSSSICSRIFAG